MRRLNDLFEKSINSSPVEAYIGATITDMKQLIVKLSN